MQMLYDSDAFAVVQVEIPTAPAREGGSPSPASRGAYEIVDKAAGTDIFLDGPMALHFRAGVEALVATAPSEDQIDAFIARYTGLPRQPLVQH